MARDYKPQRPQPCYGTIPALGGEWTITHDVSREINISASDHSGYGDFPFDRFPDIPVIDFRTCSTDQLIAAINLPGTVRPEETNPYSYKGSLDTYLHALKEIGITIHNYN